MDLTSFFEKNFEDVEIDETKNDELNILFESFLEEMKPPKKRFSIEEFINDMDPSEDEIEDEPEEREQIPPAPAVEPAPIMEPEHETEEEDQEINDNGENQDNEDENIDPERAEFDSRVRSFPAGVRLESTICKKCKLPYSKKSMKRHLLDKHNIDAACCEDYYERYTVLPTYRKIQLNKKTGKPEAKVRFTGKRGKIKNDIFPTGQLWGLKSFRKYVRDLKTNGSKREKKMVMSEQIKREKETRKMAVKRYGHFAHEEKFNCTICRRRKRAFNASVMCHDNDENAVPHAFCTPCLHRWMKVNSNKCPLCQTSGVPIKLYHN